MADQATELHHEVLQVLLERIEEDPYPSVTMLDMVEEILWPEDVPAYTQILLDKIRGDRFPSLDMLERVLAFA
jgi:hypothetical protein